MEIHNRFNPAAFIGKHLKFGHFFYSLFLLLFVLNSHSANGLAKEKQLRVLLITGGCCHNYTFQAQALKDALAKYKKADWTVINEGGTGTNAILPLFNDSNWAKGYDVVIHNECFADTQDSEYIKKITQAHFAGVPAVVIHCAMHTYRSAKTDDWREFLGVSSYTHDHQSLYTVKKVEGKHPIMNKFPDNWTSPMDELYIVEKTGPKTKILATSVSEVNGKTYPVIWTNQYGKARVFGTTFGHSDDTFKDSAFTDLLVRGILWAANK
ncbi:ThuA domain-containing protein [Flavobacterium piscis]|uniref:Type 1 glutamine amidotransferase n=1 Tax=Flavobacterium piscis TaxID=1114874 RepID=A0ABU1Y9R7_9FLAO|nr:ThuA domain-containing protein [Flavobacterium piscis]MDR7210974.1 type 1 glutamine amidotransferase [Flavobacterium piscis]